MSDQNQPVDHPQNAPTATDPHGHAPNGVPREMEGEEAKGYPHSDRAQSENAAKP